jgi:hypothetical protein
MFAGDEGGESAGRPPECNQHSAMTGGPVRRLQELAAALRGRRCDVRERRRRRICRPPARVQSTQRDGLYSEAMTKWEYVTVPLLVHATKQILDNWGQDGWELVQVVPGLNPENLVAYLKRPIPASGAGA